VANFKYGGETPDLKYGLEITLESPDGLTESAPQLQGQIFKLGGPALDGTQMKAVPCADGDGPETVILVQAKHREVKPDVPGGYKVLTGGPDQIRRIKYDGAAPTLGQSVAAAAGNLRAVDGRLWTRYGGTVIAVNTSATEVEVLI
jgi:hypothetical protein